MAYRHPYGDLPLVAPPGSRLIDGVNVGSSHRAGDALTTGGIDLTMVSRILGERVAIERVATQLRLVAPSLDDICASLLARVLVNGAIEIHQQNDGDLGAGEAMLRSTFEARNAALLREGRRPAYATSLVCGARTLVALGAPT